MQSAEKRGFDAKAATWDEEPRRVQLAREITLSILQEVPLADHMNVLDYGCGSGLVTLGIQPHAGLIIGADSSIGMLEVLKQKIREQGIDNVATQLLDLTSSESLHGDLDLVISTMTMHHVSDVEALVTSFVQALNPGGWLALADFETEDGSFHDDPVGVFHHGFDQSYIHNMLTRCGCINVRVIKASTVRKLSSYGDERLYPVFLAVGQKA